MFLQELPQGLLLIQIYSLNYKNTMKDTLLLAIDTIYKNKDTILTCSETVPLPHSTLLDNNNIWGMPENIARIAIPAIITLTVFIIGQIIVWYRAQVAIQNETKNYRTIILNWIDLIKTSIEKQVASCNELSSNIAHSQDIHPERFEYTKMLAEKADSIGVDRFITTFMINSTSSKVDDKNDKMTYNLISQFNFLKSIEHNITNTYNNYQSQILELMSEWNTIFMKLDELTLSWTPQITGSGHPYLAFHREVVKISNSWIQNAPNGRSTMVYSMANLITPLTTLTAEELTRNINNEYAFQMSAILQQLRIIDLKWRTNIDGNSRLFADTATSINNSYASLINAKQYFEQDTKVKSIFKVRK